jgi:hypothetical protein
MQVVDVLALCLLAVAWARLQLQMDERKTPINGWHYLAFVVPTSINTAWLSVASSLQILILAEMYGIRAKDLDVFAVCLAVSVVIAGLYILAKKRDAPFGITLLWALVAIAGRHPSKLIRYVCYISIAILGLFTMFALTRQRPSPLADSDDEDMPYHQSLLESRGSRNVDAEVRQDVGIQVQ